MFRYRTPNDYENAFIRKQADFKKTNWTAMVRFAIWTVFKAVYDKVRSRKPL